LERHPPKCHSGQETETETETERETETETLEALLFESRPGHALMDGREREIGRCRGGRAARM